MTAERRDLEATFGSAAHIYQQWRPGYPQDSYTARRRDGIGTATAS